MDQNIKVGSQEIIGVIGKFGLGVQNEAGQRPTDFCWENTLVTATPSSNNTRDDSTTRTSPNSQYWNQIDYILCSLRWRSSISQQKQDQELTVAQIVNSLLQTSGLNWREERKPLGHSGMNYGQRFVTLYRRRWSKPFPRKMQEGKMIVWGVLTDRWEKKWKAKE